MIIAGISILKKAKLEELLSKVYQRGVGRGYRLGQIAGEAEARNKDSARRSSKGINYGKEFIS